ncbi:hypothetical protein PFAG_01751 [Plasmodium falciparum Santa Lucia]|uniref:ATP-dependent RNA helicase DBP7 n=1 Tax=Plasmodium falciparum Santa Lucia TaxID=478859 RepID=W7FSU7_PLAFA|nr:hypothetical protein PFAG_01751 [Plasmodium falciparum Santa Lucia]
MGKFFKENKKSQKVFMHHKMNKHDQKKKRNKQHTDIVMGKKSKGFIKNKKNIGESGNEKKRNNNFNNIWKKKKRSGNSEKDQVDILGLLKGDSENMNDDDDNNMNDDYNNNNIKGDYNNNNIKGDYNNNNIKDDDVDDDDYDDDDDDNFDENKNCNDNCSSKHKRNVPSKKEHDILELNNINFNETRKKMINYKNIFDGKFCDLKYILSESLINTLEKNEFIKMTSIQKMSIPLFFKPNDIFLKSMTGSGKTLCYAIPSIEKILNMKEKVKITRDMGIFVLVLSPTRELAIQINNLFCILTKPYPYIVASCITGGEKKKSEKNRLKKGISILTCTPGRLLDHLENTKSLKLTFLKMVILDEADKIIYLGTQDKIKLIYDMIRKIKQEEFSKVHKKKKKEENEVLDHINDTNMSDMNNISNDHSNDYEQFILDKFQMIFISATLNHAMKTLANYCLTNNTMWIEKEKKNGINGGNKNDETKQKSNDMISCMNRENSPLNIHNNDDNDDNDENNGDNNNNNDDNNNNNDDNNNKNNDDDNNNTYELPEQLKQYCILIDMKQKFICLIYMLLDCIEKKKKPVVFLSNHHSVEYLQILLKNIYWPTDVNKKNIEVNKKLNEKITPVLEREDEKLLRKHLEQNILNNNYYNNNYNVGNISYKNINLEEIQNEDELNDEPGNLYNINADKHKRIYLFNNVNIYILHGNLSKEDRLGNFMDFSKTNNSILLCTDIISRGIHFDSLSVVIQYDPPQILEEYIHKVGRTARLNKQGSAYLFLLKSQKQFLNILKNKNIQLKIILGNTIINHFKKFCIPNFLKSVGKDILNFLHNHMQTIVKSNNTLMEKGTSAFLCTITSFYSTSKNLRSIFNAKDIHLGHLAYTFLLEKTPKQISKYKKEQNYINIKKQTVLSKKEKRLLKSKQFQKKQKRK